jgi:hypothetical protein
MAAIVSRLQRRASIPALKTAGAGLAGFVSWLGPMHAHRGLSCQDSSSSANSFPVLTGPADGYEAAWSPLLSLLQPRSRRGACGCKPGGCGGCSRRAER